jgi:hypothetical protein
MSMFFASRATTAEKRIVIYTSTLVPEYVRLARISEARQVCGAPKHPSIATSRLGVVQFVTGA